MSLNLEKLGNKKDKIIERTKIKKSSILSFFILQSLRQSKIPFINLSYYFLLTNKFSELTTPNYYGRINKKLGISFSPITMSFENTLKPSIL
ncbi:MAG TPA: hypothetical protein VN026_17385, partial [Bacteroidia bacterium]|nr:hypothetical protein [Bacteroidia bacterium]